MPRPLRQEVISSPTLETRVKGGFVQLGSAGAGQGSATRVGYWNRGDTNVEVLGHNKPLAQADRRLRAWDIAFLCERELCQD